MSLMKLKIEPYLQQQEKWPQKGKVIMAQYDADSIVVYQAYRPEIGHFAAKHGYFGGEFKLSMSRPRESSSGRADFYCHSLIDNFAHPRFDAASELSNEFCVVGFPAFEFADDF
jgi:Domain of unknown function (DUF4291)